MSYKISVTCVCTRLICVEFGEVLLSWIITDGSYLELQLDNIIQSTVGAQEGQLNRMGLTVQIHE